MYELPYKLLYDLILMKLWKPQENLEAGDKRPIQTTDDNRHPTQSAPIEPQAEGYRNISKLSRKPLALTSLSILKK